ncbi:MAG: NADH-quinone oxidoreductase subunit NuoN [Actinomycetes bacterium]
MNFTAPVIDWIALLPILIVLGAGALGVLLEALIRVPATRRTLQVALSAIALVAALASVIALSVTIDGPGVDAVSRMVSIDRQSLLWQGILLVLALLSLLLFADRTRTRETAFTPLASASPGSVDEALARRKGLELTEVFPLALLSLGGMMLFVATTELVLLFVALEMFSLPLYIIVAIARRRRLLAQEAAVKYFLLGAFASAVFLFGVALVYGALVRTGFAEISLMAAVIGSRDELVLVGFVFVLVGLLFKLGAVPFHQWTPDVYEGAPTPVTAFMAALVKGAAAAALLRVWFGFMYRMELELEWIVWAVAIATMLLGSIVALRQTSIKRMLAYSSIGHAGFILVALAGPGDLALSSVAFYVIAYGLATLGAFAVVTQVRERTEDGSLGAEAWRLGQWAGLGKRSPLLAAAMALFLLSFAGIPLTAGFIGKFVVFGAAVADGGWPLVLIAVIASAIAAFFYVRLIVLMYFTDAPDDVENAVAVEPTRGASVVVAVTAVATLVLGVVPSWVLSLTQDAAVLVVSRL